MKKILALLLAAVMVFALVACNNNNDDTENEDVTVRVMALKGPTGMGMVQLMENDKNGTAKNDYDIKLAAAPAEVTAAVIAGTVDIAAVPVNLAAVLFNKPDVDISFAAVNTLGVLYLMENGNTISSLDDIKGKKIYATGQGATPQYILEALLKRNNIDPETDVEIEYIAEHAELATKLATNDAAIGLLPEPQVTVALTTAKKNDNNDLRIALNITEEWAKLGKGELVQGCIIVSDKFKEEHPEQLAKFMEEYKASTVYVVENPKDASVLIAEHGIIPQAPLAEKAIPNCNICCIDGETGISYMKNILEVLYAANPSSVGGKLPTDEFYGK
ncbi:MAG: ABC transporter substrate-binding protein [Ruminococcaceae bacterium]|nr:ABC transporter substrate-binding protein [Oscillospiraceae bacterium]